MQKNQKQTQQSKKESVFQDILKRAIFGALFLVITLAAISFSVYTWAILAMIYSLGCLFEFTNLDPIAKNGKTLIRTAGFLLWASVFAYLFTEELLFLISWILILPLVFLTTLKTKDNRPFTQASAFLLSIFYTVLPFVSLVMMGIGLEDGEYHFELIIMLFMLIWANDSFAYLFGRMLGKNKMAPSISPGKSWEGFAGGAIMTLVVSLIIGHYFIDIDLIHIAMMVIIVVPLGVLGDLVESKWKRSLEIKDSGNFLPGHGGFLDRFDSILISAPIIFCYFYAVKTILF